MLVISTLDNEYSIIDYRIYTNGIGAENVVHDTIAIPQYNKDTVIVNIMHPNEFETPIFSVDGIRKEKLIITENLKLKIK